VYVHAKGWHVDVRNEGMMMVTDWPCIWKGLLAECGSVQQWRQQWWCVVVVVVVMVVVNHIKALVVPLLFLVA